MNALGGTTGSKHTRASRGDDRGVVVRDEIRAISHNSSCAPFWWLSRVSALLGSGGLARRVSLGSPLRHQARELEASVLALSNATQPVVT